MAKTKQPTRTWALVLSLGVPLAIVGIAAMMMTFATLIDVAKINGLPFPMMFPVVVDVGMIATMITAAQFRLRDISGQWLAYAWFFTLSAVSVIANGTHALQAANMALTTPVGAALFGAVPSATLLVITHLVMKTVPDEKERAKLAEIRERGLTGVVSSVPSVGRSTPSVSARPTQAQAVPAPGRDLVRDLVREQSAAVAWPVPVSGDQEEVRAKILAHYKATGDRPTGAMVGDWLGGKSAKTGQRFITKLAAEGVFAPLPILTVVGS